MGFLTYLCTWCSMNICKWLRLKILNFQFLNTEKNYNFHSENVKDGGTRVNDSSFEVKF